jgi:hypothetical protein
MRGQGFNHTETSALLDLVQIHLPISAHDWDNIARSHLVYYPESRRTSDSLRRKFNSLCATKPKTGETHAHPNVERAKIIRSSITQRTGSNNGDDDELLNDIFQDEAVDLYEEDDVGFNPPTTQTPIFIRQQSSVSSENIPTSASRVLQPSPVPQPLSTSTFEVSRRGTRLGTNQAQQQQSAMMEMFMLQRQQQMEDERNWRLQEMRRRDDEARRREELAAEETRRRAEDRRDMQQFLQAALSAFIAINANQKDDRNYDGRDNNNPSSS